MSLYTFHYPACIFFQIQTLVSQHWSERQIWAKLSSALLNLYPSNASYSQGETIKEPFLSLSLSHWYLWLCRPNPVKLTPCGKKNTHKCLKLNPPNRTALIQATYPEILTGAPNGEGREDKTYKLSKKNNIRRDVNPTLTYALSHGGYRIKYKVAWHSGLVSWPAWGRTDVTITVSMLWRTRFAASTQPILRMGPNAKGSADTFGL